MKEIGLLFIVGVSLIAFGISLETLAGALIFLGLVLVVLSIAVVYVKAGPSEERKP